MQEDFKFDEEVKEPEREPERKLEREPIREPVKEPTKETVKEPQKASSILLPPLVNKGMHRSVRSKFEDGSKISREQDPAYGSKHGSERFMPEEISYNHFYVGVTGYIESGDFPFLDGLCCRYSFTAGKNWQLVNVLLNNILQGIDTGISQHAFKPDYGDSNKMVWNFPIEALFRSVTPHGWPQLVITCSARDFLGRENNYAYGTIHVPTIIGRQERYIKMFSPAPTNWWSRFTSWLSGNYKEYINGPKTLSETNERDISRVTAQGTLKIVFQVTLTNLNKFGFH